MLEAVDAIAQERHADPPAATRCSSARCARSPSATTRSSCPAFFLKLLAHEGFQPRVDGCAVCDVEEPLVAFDLDEGGLLCPEHRRGAGVSPEAVALLRLVLGGRLGEALNAAARRHDPRGRGARHPRPRAPPRAPPPLGQLLPHT